MAIVMQAGELSQWSLDILMQDHTDVTIPLSHTLTIKMFD